MRNEAQNIDDELERQRQLRFAIYERERVERRITFLMDANSTITVLNVDYNTSQCNGPAQARNRILNNIPLNVDRNLFLRELDGELERFESNRTELERLTTRSRQLTRIISRLS